MFTLIGTWGIASFIKPLGKNLIELRLGGCKGIEGGAAFNLPDCLYCHRKSRYSILNRTVIVMGSF